jgi:hypothetical protein
MFPAISSAGQVCEPLLLRNPLRGVNSRQEGKLTNRIRLLTGNRNGEAKGLSRLPVFLAILDQHVPLISRHVSW